MTLKELEAHFLREIDTLYAEDEAKELFSLTTQHILGWTRSQAIMNRGQAVTEAHQFSYQHIIHGLQQGRPIQHILGEAAFYGLKFKVGPAVLIPRPETEELVQWIIQTVNSAALKQAAILDVGTGSGCIAISLAKSLPDAKVSALDVSTAALQIAEDNALENQTAIRFIHADILAFRTEQKYDLIVSNPPYITPAEREEMLMNVLDHEPHLALFVPEDNPLIFYKAIADLAVTQLKPGGLLFFEINEYLAKEMLAMLASKGLSNIQLKQDMQGKDRMICCMLE